MRKTACAMVIASLVAGCATEGGTGYSIGGSQATGQGAVGAGIGAVAGNVLGYMTGTDRTTATVLGALIGGGIGYWRGLQADRRLQQAEASSKDIAQVQSNSQYQYEQPKLYAKEAQQGGQKVATFDKLETPIPYEAVKNHSEDAVQVLRKLGGLAAKNDSDVFVYAPTKEARDYMISQIRRGAGGARLTIESTYSKETKVVIGGVPA
jgi:uncharacterized protein YcfJ